MSNSADHTQIAKGAIVFALYFDPAELDALLEAPGYLRGVFLTHQDALIALRAFGGDPADVRWQIVEEATDELGWASGFVTVRPEDD